MAVVEPGFTARQMHDVSVLLDKGGVANPDGYQFRKATQSFQFVPSASVSSVVGGTRDAVFTDTTPPTWTLVWKLLQDIEKSGSLLNYLLANAGKTQAVEFIPNGGAKVGATIILAAPPIGGDVNAWLVGQITCGVVGAPAVTGTVA